MSLFSILQLFIQLIETASELKRGRFSPEPVIFLKELKGDSCDNKLVGTIKHKLNTRWGVGGWLEVVWKQRKTPKQENSDSFHSVFDAIYYTTSCKLFFLFVPPLLCLWQSLQTLAELTTQVRKLFISYLQSFKMMSLTNIILIHIFMIEKKNYVHI